MEPRGNLTMMGDAARQSRLSLLSLKPGNPGRAVVTIWDRSKARIDRLLGARGARIQALPEFESMASQEPYLPNEILEMIIAHFSYDLDTLKACSLTCRFWYIAVAPHLHKTLILGKNKDLYTFRGGLKPLSKLHELNLFPFVKEIQVLRWGWPGNSFDPRSFQGPNDLFYFSAFTNVQILRIQSLDIGRFFPDIERYFIQFSSTLRSISLDDPACGSPKQFCRFLSLFPKLDDVHIRGLYPSSAPILNTELTPFSAPSMRGRLTLHCFSTVETWTNLIQVCGGLRFRTMALRGAGGCTQILLKTCADTLETLRLHMSDHADLPHHKFDLSRLKVLRSLEVWDWTTQFNAPDSCRSAVVEAFSTIKSPVFSEFVIVLLWSEHNHMLSDGVLYETLRKVYEIRPFQLVFLFQISCPASRDVQWMFEGMLESMAAKGLLNFLDFPPTIRVEDL